jgi:MerR family redox-sensitive transcriptional activator SoxR
MKKDPLLSIGAIAKRTGTSVSAIRFYESESLVPSVRSASGHRFFHRSAIRRVSFILIAQNLGYTLSQIAEVLKSLPEQRTPTKADWDKLGRVFSRDIEHRIDQLTVLKESLSACIGCGCLSLKSCRLYNPEDRAVERGSGPRYLLGDPKPLVKI